jgi:hypothetical protein
MLVVDAETELALVELAAELGLSHSKHGSLRIHHLCSPGIHAARK